MALQGSEAEQGRGGGVTGADDDNATIGEPPPVSAEDVGKASDDEMGSLVLAERRDAAGADRIGVGPRAGRVDDRSGQKFAFPPALPGYAQDERLRRTAFGPHLVSGRIGWRGRPAHGYQQPDAGSVQVRAPGREQPDVAPLRHAGASLVTRFEDSWGKPALQQVCGGRQTYGTRPDDGNGKLRSGRHDQQQELVPVPQQSVLLPMVALGASARTV